MKDTTYLERYLKVGLQRNYKRLYFRIDSNLLRDETIEKIIQDCERDYYLDPKDAIEYGLIDEII